MWKFKYRKGYILLRQVNNKKSLPKIIKFNKNLLKNVDVIFTALPNGESQKISNFLTKKNILIDLSADFRLKKQRFIKIGIRSSITNQKILLIVFMLYLRLVEINKKI